MRRKFITNLALLLFLNLLIKPIWILIEILIQNEVRAEEFGVYSPVFFLTTSLYILLDMGITNYNNKNISQHQQLVTKHFSNIITIRFSLSIIYILVCVLIGYFIGYNERQLKFLLILGFNQFLLQFILYLRSNITGLQLFKANSFLSQMDRFFMILITIALLWGTIGDHTFKIEWFVYTQTVAYLLTAVITFIFMLSKVKSFSLRFDFNFFLVILKQSWPYALLILLMSFYTYNDSVLLERLLPDGKMQAGIYAQSYRILIAATQYGLVFSSLLLPMFARMLKQKEDITQLFKLSYSFLIVPAIILAVSSYYYKQEIMDLLYNEHTQVSAPIFFLHMVSFIGFGTTSIVGALLTANANMKELNYMALFVFILFIISSIFLVPIYGALGSALVCLIVQITAAVIQLFIAKKVFQLNINWKLIFLLFTFTFGVIGIGFLTKEFMNSWSLGFATLIGASLLLALGVKLFNIKELRHILKNKEGV